VATYTCPDGHTSQSGDYCDVCGLPIAAAGASPLPPPLPAPAATPVPAGGPAASALPVTNPLSLGTPGPAATRSCPNCGTDNPADALFCENCGYDFTTGQLPRPLDPPDASQPADLQPVPPPVPAPPVPAGTPANDGAGAAAPASWVAEVWVDPDWYASQGVSDPLPSVGAPAVVPLDERSVLVGRTSASRNIHPQIDCSSDNGVSRRHAQLTTDGQRWWIEDLQSSNGTYIGGAGEPLPTTPVAPGQRVELADDDRVYVGAWTRIVVRQA
jgi:hypothetical protein